MSQDLLEAFGYSKGQELERNPWRDECNQSNIAEHFEGDSNDFGDFEAPVERSTPLRQNLVRFPDKNDTTHSEESTSAHGEDSDWGDFVDQSEEMQADGDEIQAVNSPKLQVKGSRTMVESSTVPTTSSLRADVDSRPVGSNLETRNVYTATASSEQKPPPTNIPPPSILLPLTAILFHSLPAEIKGLVAALKSSGADLNSFGSNELAEITSRISFLRASARIIAGRKLRWKRDTLLAQSMKIGQAQAGNIGGMKLTGVDRMESRREDQEAAEAVRIWKQEIGSLRSAIRMVNSKLTALHLPGLATPEIADNMPIRTGKASDDARTAPKCCFLCGLKREERVEKVDVDVFDNFGEWWADHWGHTDCKAFWLEHEGSLRLQK